MYGTPFYLQILSELKRIGSLADYAAAAFATGMTSPNKILMQSNCGLEQANDSEPLTCRGERSWKFERSA